MWEKNGYHEVSNDETQVGTQATPVTIGAAHHENGSPFLPPRSPLPSPPETAHDHLNEPPLSAQAERHSPRNVWFHRQGARQSSQNLDYLMLSPPSTASETGRPAEYRSSNYGSSSSEHLLPPSFKENSLPFDTAPQTPVAAFIDYPKEQPFIPQPHISSNEPGSDKHGIFPPLPPGTIRRLSSSSSLRNSGHPFFPHHFEKPNYYLLIRHVTLCVFAFNVIYLVGNGGVKRLPLFWARVIVGLGCGFVGFVLGWSLLDIARRHLEAVMWATIVHESMHGNQRGVTLRELGELTYDPLSQWSGWLLLYRRMVVYNGVKRANRKYDTRHWSIYLIGFLTLCALTSCLPFIIARIINIDVSEVQQYKQWSQVSIVGDLSPADVARAKSYRLFFEDMVRTWTIHSVASSLNLPHAVSLPWENDQVYFSEAYTDQLIRNGSGYGMFDGQNKLKFKTDRTLEGLTPKGLKGAILRWPRWGLRVKCISLPNPNTNIIMSTPGKFDYAYIPQSLISLLFASISKPVPPELTGPFSNKMLRNNDTPPIGFDTSQISFVAPFPHNGVGVSIFSKPLLGMGADGSGWLQLETVMVRVNPSLAPHGVFPAYFNNGTYRIGYDVAVCAEIVEPYVVEAYNGTCGSPQSLGIMYKANTVLGQESSRTKVQEQAVRNLGSALNSTGKENAWIAAHDNSRNVLLKDNGRDQEYVPSPTTISFTNGDGPEGYTKLDPVRVANTLAEGDASNLLPYLVGSASILAHKYPDRTAADTQIDVCYLFSFIGVVLVMGLVGVMCVPTLPLGLPRRSFSTASLATLRGDGLPSKGDRSWEEEELEVLEKKLGKSKLRFGA
ncbi:hypothetical protein BOTBODRAFT_36497 [Botryobasidium botryosum FD-172 SS1]|uniref:Uncharacterized protein n=1 Tax=Botryobasidium botryosum (strain FD-172 SS1) TaxID=930990 RepID=A0A067MDT5_BOTB1|nr:hypothetical protein BOTBODRAFT_36497 [Botryobasidium botryosum FD-172 SS1]